MTDKPKKKRGRKSNKEIDKVENYDPEKTSDINNLILNLKGGNKESKSILPGYDCDNKCMEEVDFDEGLDKNKCYFSNDLSNFSDSHSKEDGLDCVCCWNCSHSIDNHIVTIPHKYIKQIFYINGSFCSYECAARYIYDNYNGSEMWDKIALLSYYFNLSTNNVGKRITPAPNKLMLKKFGGNLDIQEYRKLSMRKQKHIDIYLPPIIPISHDEYCYEGKLKNNELNGELRLYRKKPLNNKNNIYDTMNLKVNDDS